MPCCEPNKLAKTGSGFPAAPLVSCPKATRGEQSSPLVDGQRRGDGGEAPGTGQTSVPSPLLEPTGTNKLRTLLNSHGSSFLRAFLHLPAAGRAAQQQIFAGVSFQTSGSSSCSPEAAGPRAVSRAAALGNTTALPPRPLTSLNQGDASQQLEMEFLINYREPINKQKIVRAPYVWFASLRLRGKARGGSERARAAQAEPSGGLAVQGQALNSVV